MIMTKLATVKLDIQESGYDSVGSFFSQILLSNLSLAC